jgi:hypothetical protein
MALRKGAYPSNPRANTGKPAPAQPLKAIPPVSYRDGTNRIEVFINECDADRAVHFSYSEDECIYGSKPGPLRTGVPNTTPPPKSLSSRESPLPSPTTATVATPPRQRSNSLGSIPTEKPQTKEQKAAVAALRYEPPKEKRGAVPGYLVKRKEEMQAEKDLVLRQQEEIKNHKGPPGTVLLTEPDRAAILRDLEAQKETVLGQINRLPMRYDTASIQNRRREWEAQLTDIEDKIGKYSRKEVYVPRQY